MILILSVITTGLILGKLDIMEYSTYYILAGAALAIDFIFSK
jgi:hypothetical protein